MDTLTVLIEHAKLHERHSTELRDLRTRVYRVERKHRLPRLPWKQLLPALYGLLILALAFGGKITWETAQTMLGSAH